MPFHTANKTLGCSKKRWYSLILNKAVSKRLNGIILSHRLKRSISVVSEKKADDWPRWGDIVKGLPRCVPFRFDGFLKRQARLL